MRTGLTISLSALACVLGACKENDEKKGRASIQLATVPSRAMTLTQAPAGGLSALEVYSSAVKINSLKVPIHLVSLAGPDVGGGYIYQCPSTTDVECQVELVGTDLTNLLTASNTGGEIRAGLADSLAVYYKNGGCESASTGQSGNIVLSAETTFKGKTYYTKATGELSETGPAEGMNLAFGGCGTGTAVTPAVDIPEGGSVTLKAFMDITNMATISDRVPADYTREKYINCIKASDDSALMCLSAPDIGVTIDEGSPSVERYAISYESAANTEGCGGLLGLFVDSTGAPFGGYLRNYWYETQVCGSQRALAYARISTYSKNSDGTFKIADGFDNGLPPLPSNTWPSFQRADHEGVMKRAEVYPPTTENTTEKPYIAKRLP